MPAINPYLESRSDLRRDIHEVCVFPEGKQKALNLLGNRQMAKV